MQALPSGTITFLFTDIEGSTPLWERLPDAMQSALARHDAIMREAITAAGGHVFKTAGDAFFAVFAGTPAAVFAACRAQQALHDEPWPETGPLGVRMAIDTGLAEPRDGDYFGPPLNRAARLLAAGHGGQILISAVTETMLEQHLPEGAALRYLGEHRLKGLARPERIFQLLAPGLPADFPPLRVPDTLDDHYEMVGRGIEEGRVVLFLGMDANLCGRPLATRWSPGRFDCLPSEVELAEHLARTFAYPVDEPVDLVRVSQYVAVKSGVGPLYDELHALFDADYPATPLHRFVAALPALLRAKGAPRPYQLIVTTSYDDALERAFQGAGEPHDLVTYVAEGEGRGRFAHRGASGEIELIDRPNEYRGLSLDERTVILKIHGAVDRVQSQWDSFVITEDHYIEYLTRADLSNLLPVTLAAKLRRSHYLFLGYRLRDWNLRVILHRIWGQQRLTYKSWAIQEHSPGVEHDFWRTREVDIHTVKLEEYIGALHERIAARPSLAAAHG